MNHGMYSTYVYHKCRCDLCRKANADYRRQHYDSEQNFVAKLRGYGLSLNEYLTIMVLQDSKCAICEKDFTPEMQIHVDHDHTCCPKKRRSCGKCVRGLLCGECNLGLGKFRDNLTVLQKAVSYIGAY